MRARVSDVHRPTGGTLARIITRPCLPVALVAAMTIGMALSDTRWAGASQKYPFDPRYPSVACQEFKPKTVSSLPPPTPTDTNAFLSMVHGHFVSSSTCSWGYLVVLTPGSEALAQQIRERFGNTVQVFIGAFPSVRTWNCWPPLPSTSTPPGLKLSLHLDAKSVQVGDNFRGSLTISYKGTGSFLMDTGQPLVVDVVRRGTLRVVGTYTGGISGTGYGERLTSGQSYRVDVLGGTSQCDGSTSAISAGEYQVIAQVMDETGKTPRYLAPPVSLTVIGLPRNRGAAIGTAVPCAGLPGHVPSIAHLSVYQDGHLAAYRDVASGAPFRFVLPPSSYMISNDGLAAPGSPFVVHADHVTQVVVQNWCM